MSKRKEPQNEILVKVNEFIRNVNCHLQIPSLLQPLHESHAVVEIRTQIVQLHQRENGGNATAQHVLDRSKCLWNAIDFLLSIDTNKILTIFSLFLSFDRSNF